MSAPVGYLHFDTAPIQARDRFDYWRDRVLPLRLEPPRAAASPFWVRADTLHGTDLSVIEMSRGPAVARWGRDIGEHQARLRLILLAPTAGAAASWYGHDLPLDHGIAALVGASDGWWRAPAGMRGIQADLSRAAIDVDEDELARIHQRQQLATDPVFTTLIRPMLTGMAGNLHALAAASGAELDTIWTALIRMLVRSLRGRDTNSVDLTPARRVQAERFIASRLSDPRLTPDAVAAALHLSRRALYASIFPGDGGVAGYIRAQRLARARELLQTTTLPVATIAAAVGLPNPALFSRLFRAAYGHSPREMRPRRAIRPAGDAGSQPRGMSAG